MPRAEAAALLLALAAASPATALTCTRDDFEGAGYTVCSVAAADAPRLWLGAPDGLPYGSFDRLAADLGARGQQLAFAMNAGMYRPDRRPVGLLILDGQTVAPVVTRAGPGNFGMLPNGVFCIGAAGFAVIESRAFAADPPDCRFATQSGPMLVVGGALHPRFLPDSTSLNIRNGVGVSADGQTAYFAISDTPVSFHAFARLFRDRLGTPAALFLDGSISRLYAPSLGRNDGGLPMGPIVGVALPAGVDGGGPGG